jgi:hypothetical protein
MNYVMLGFANYTLVKAIKDYEKHGSPDGLGLNYSAFVIPEPCKTFIRVTSDEFKQIKQNLLPIEKN